MSACQSAQQAGELTILFEGYTKGWDFLKATRGRGLEAGLEEFSGSG